MEHFKRWSRTFTSGSEGVGESDEVVVETAIDARYFAEVLRAEVVGEEFVIGRYTSNTR